MVEQPISGFLLAEFRVVPVAADAALVTYIAAIDTPDGAHHRMAVGEYWFLQNGSWFIRGFSGTLVP